MQTFATFFAVGAVTALAFEMMKVWELQNKFDKRRFRRLVSSVQFWLLVGGMSLASGWFAWLLNSEHTPPATLGQVGLRAIAIRSIIRLPLEAAASKQGMHQGEPAVTLWDTFK